MGPRQPLYEIDVPGGHPFFPFLVGFPDRIQSDELDTVYRVVLEEGTLVAHHYRHGAIHLSPAWGDDFTTDAWFMRSIEFQRGPGGIVSGFLVNGGERVRNLRFGRSSGPSNR